jgi:hypothetical protein
MEFLGPGFLNWDGLSHLPKLDAASIKRIVIEKLVVSYADCNSASYTTNFGVDHRRHLCRRLAKFGSTDSDNYMLHFSKLQKKVPAFLVTHFIKLTCGALNSDAERRRKYSPDGSVHPNKGVGNPFPCYLCNRGDAVLFGDCSRHVFGSCKLVETAWEGVINNNRGPRDEAWVCLLSKKVTPCFVLDFPLADVEAGYNRLALVMSFCWAVHKTIDQIRSGRSAIGSDSRIVTLTISLRNIWAPIKKSK